MTPRRKNSLPPKRLRARAEKLLAKTSREVAQMPVDDMQKLVHELQVHQIELEMQNDELRQTQLELEAAREKLLLPYDAAPVGFLTLDARSVICEANRAAARLLNFDHVKLPGQKLTHFIAPESQDIFYLHRRQLLTTGEKQTCELHFLRTDGPRFIARLESVMEQVTSEPANRSLVMVSDITEQKRAEEALHESEARFRNMSDAAPVLIWLSGPDKLCIYFNKPWLEFTGRALEQELGNGWAEGVHPDDLQRCLQIYVESFDARREFRMEYRLKRHDGEYRWILDHGVPRFAAEQEFLGYIGSCIDITERRLMEEALLLAHDKLDQRVRERTKELTVANAALRGEKAFSDSLIELAPGAIAVVDEQGNLIRTNAYAEELTGHPFAETQGRNMITMLVPANEQPRVRRLLREALQGRAMQHLVAPLRIRDGSIRQIEWFAKPLANAAGKLAAVLTIGHDITERKQAEAALRRSELHLSIFFDRAPIGLFWLSASGTILRVNQAHLDLTGYSAAEIAGHSFLEFCIEQPQGHELLARLARQETVRNLRMAWRCKDGSIRHVLVDANSFWIGNVFQYSSIFLRDITDRINLEREILHISEREHRRIAQDLHDGLGQLLVGAAYLAGTLRQDLAANSRPEARKLGRIEKVISEAVAQSRNLARGLHPVEPEPNGLMAALEALAVRTKKLFQVRCHFNCHHPVLIPDNTVATHLFRIAQEAVTNAIKHGKPGRIGISLTETPGHINLAVRDDGSGLPARQRKKAGMGLRIMRYRAGMIGGSLAIQKEPGGGTTVVCTVHLSRERIVKPKPKTTRQKRSRKD